MSVSISPRQISAIEALIDHMEKPGRKMTPSQREFIVEQAKAAVAILKGAK